MAYQPKVGDKVRVLVDRSKFGNKINTDVPHVVTELMDSNTIAIDLFEGKYEDTYGERVIAPHQVEPWLSPKAELERKRAKLAQLQSEIAELERAEREKTPAQELAELESYLKLPFNNLRIAYTRRNNVVAASVVGQTFHKVGIAVFAIDDIFDETVGKLIALKQALGHEFDASKYVKKVPYEPKIGDYVRVLVSVSGAGKRIDTNKRYRVHGGPDDSGYIGVANSFDYYSVPKGKVEPWGGAA